MFKKGRAKKASVSIPKRRWKANRPNQRAWDSTVSDLTVHRATEEEVQRRRLIHKSKNASAARRALGERARKLFMDPASPGQVQLEMKKLAILKEVLYEHDDLNEVLKRVDNTMSSVKTIFHEAPFRTSGNPNVTLAPGSKSTSGNITIPIREEPTTQMSLLSDSVMDKHALNEESSCTEDEEDDGDQFESKVDYERFLNVLRESLKKSVTAPEPGPAGDASVTPVNNGKPEMHQALNCTEEVKRTMKRIGNQDSDGEDDSSANPTRKIDDTIVKLTVGRKDGERKKNNSVSFSLLDESKGLPPRANLNATNLTYENLQDAMEAVTSNLEEIEVRRGGKILAETANTSVKSDGLAGFTTTLIDAVTRLTVYVNEAEGKLIAAESRMEDLKNQNDHQRALLDALTAELMGSQDQIHSLKNEMMKQQEAHKEHEDFKTSIKAEVKELRDMVNDLKKQVKGDTNAAGDVNTVSKSAIAMQKELHMVQANNMGRKDEDEEEEGLKSDMLSLLTALKSHDKQQPQGTVPQPTGQVLTMNNAATRGAAQTVASVESQLKHLQLQHAEAHNRLQELTQVAGLLAGRISETQTMSSSSSGSERNTPSTHDSSATPSIVSGPITPKEEFLTMKGTSGNETDESVSGITITSSMFANNGGDTSRPSVQSSAFSQNFGSPPINRKFVEDSSSLKSSDRINISDDSFQELVPRNVPALLQSNLFGMSVTAGAVKILNPTSPSSQDFPQPALPPFKPANTANYSAPETVSNSIQQTQFNLEDRIAELNRQHAEAQARLQNLIRKRTNVCSPSSVSSHSSGSGSSMKVIQVTLPTEDMLQTPQIHRAPEPLQHALSQDYSFT